MPQGQNWEGIGCGGSTIFKVQEGERLGGLLWEMLQPRHGSDLPHIGSHCFGQNAVLWPSLKQRKLRDVSQLRTQEEEQINFGGLPAASTMLWQSFFQTKSSQMRSSELFLGAASAYAYVSVCDGSGGRS